MSENSEHETVVVYGGSFDPPHVSHCLAVSYVLMTNPIDRVLVIPTFKHPFDKPLTPFVHRSRMCELAFADDPRVTVSTVEEELGGESRTLRTLETLRERHPHWNMRLLMGADLLIESPKWYGFDRIAQIAKPLVVGRVGYAHEAAPTAVLPEVSSKDIRAKIAAGDASVRELLPQRILAYIHEHELYGARTQHTP